MSFAAPTMGSGSYSGFYTATVGIPSADNAASYNAVPRIARSSTEYQLARLLAKSGFRGMRRVMKVLNGASAGSAASETHLRIAAVTPFVGAYSGLRTMETVTDNTGNTTTAQRDYINTNILDMRYNANPTSYPTDLSGNGGGGKVGF